MSNLAKRTDISAQVLETILSKSRSTEVEMMILKNPTCPPEILAGFAEADVFIYDFIAASHTNTPTDVLERLAVNSKYEQIREKARNNPSTPQWTKDYQDLRKDDKPSKR